jgi:hypothetical protein
LKAYFGKRDVFETYVTGKVENLSVGALVQLRGVTIGKVSSIDSSGRNTRNTSNDMFSFIRGSKGHGLERGGQPRSRQTLDLEVAQGLRARVQGQGLLGANILVLEYVDPKQYPVEPVPWTPKHYYIPSAPNQFNRVMASLEKVLRRAEDLDLAGLLERAKTLIDAANRLGGKRHQIDFGHLGTNAGSLL